MGQKLVVFHIPGPNWQPGENFQEQPHDMVMEHVQHYRNFLKQGKLFHGGPFIDNDSGGMMIANEGIAREELEEFASSDPAVIAGLLNFEVKTWYVAMTM